LLVAKKIILIIHLYFKTIIEVTFIQLLLL